jgi:hypothetical protein
MRSGQRQFASNTNCLQQGVDFVLDNLLGMHRVAEPIIPSQAANGGWSFAVPCS